MSAIKVVDERASKQQDRYRVIRVNFRRTHPWWWDNVYVVALLLEVTLMAAGMLLLFTRWR